MGVAGRGRGGGRAGPGAAARDRAQRDRATAPAAITTAVAPTQPSPATTTPKPSRSRALSRPRRRPGRTEAPIPDSASGPAIVPGTVPAKGPGMLISYRLEIEAGLPLDGAGIAAQVQRVTNLANILKIF